MLTPFFIDTFGLHFKSFLALEILAKDLSGSPGLFGILIFSPPIILAIAFTVVSFPDPRLYTSPFFPNFADLINPSTKSSI